MIAAVIFFAAGYWLFSARKWYHGPVKRISDEELQALEAEAKSQQIGESAVRSPNAEAPPADAIVVQAPADAPVNEVVQASVPADQKV